jgi:hypothetical protein
MMQAQQQDYQQYQHQQQQQYADGGEGLSPGGMNEDDGEGYAHS